MLYKEVLIQLLISYIIRILELFLLLVEIKPVNIFIKLLVKLEKEHNAIWAPRITVSSCQIVIKRMLLTLSSMLPSEPVDKDAWL